MMVRLRKRFDWCSGMVYQGVFYANFYRAELAMITHTASHHEQNVAYERMKYWMLDVLANSILIHDQDPTLAQWQATGARVLCLPEPPVDQIVGMMLYAKLNAIMEKRMQIHDIEIASAEGDDMVYQHCTDEALGGLAAEGWWQDARPIWVSDPVRRNRSKVVTLDRVAEWVDHGMSWHADTDAATNVVFADFKTGHDENHPIR